VSAPHPHRELLAYLRLLAGDAQAGQFFDVRWGTAAGPMRRRFLSALAVRDTARLITRLARRYDVYIGVALRDGSTHGGKSAISGSRVLCIECDDPTASERIAGFAHPPSMEVASGTTGHLHLYWCLQQRVAARQVESANRRLAHDLGGDPASVDIARILRPPGTFNYKHDPPTAVVLLAYREGARYTLAQLTVGLPKDSRPGRRERAIAPPGRAQRTELDRQLLAIPPADYVRVLAGRSPNRAGKVLCPFHDDTVPSLQLYPDGSFYCFGCGKGGTIIDFAAHLWHINPRGAGFIELRKRLAERFSLERAPCS